MFILGLILAVFGCIFGFRWFSVHKFEYLEGVKPSEQMDQNFWMSMGFLCSAMVLMLIGAL